ncbi:DMT family transporter [Bacillus safensis]|uniref:DMT family transporter n=1 Tax=Bacillus safensis TaxID=561879 RepID=UPI00227F4784|nr:DMT family transporter [Bacillus safensis]MCY7473992.1 DMT family transporter [Bacillus safensis]MCY7508692.1 DMT family transporter [Bacillus safensis]MCY7515722.1 DMT family transporter [Bacillus safensis]MED4707933.1 DMT family transporter [Bacillus safensis]
MKNKQLLGHLAAMFTIFLWGSTFISTKILLTAFSPTEILFFRFFIGYLALIIIYPVTMKVRSKKHEGMFALAGLCGVVLYYFLENVALTYTFASNAGVISSVVPFFSFLLAYFLLKDEPLHSRFFIGFFIAMTGIVLISMNGMTTFQLNPLGDALALTAAIVWAFYSILSKMINQYGYHIIQVTRRVFFYGLLWMIPLIWHFKIRLDWERLTNPSFAFHLLFLGLFASAICFLTWSFSVKTLGVVKSSVYIYGVPIITMVISMIVLHERLTLMSALGTALTLGGLLLSDKKSTGRKKQKPRVLMQDKKAL